MKLILENWRQYLEEDVGGFTAEYQLFIPRSCPDKKCDPAKLGSSPPVANDNYMNKPHGGLWTSTATEADDGWTSAWNEWMKDNMPQWMHAQGVLLRPKTDNVFHIETTEDTAALYDEFPLEATGEDSPRKHLVAFGIGGKLIDFEAALKKYDGIHWGIKSGGRSGDWNFGRSGMWDVESTVWRDISVLEVAEVVSTSQRGARERY
jgi:hypothetical protein